MKAFRYALRRVLDVRLIQRDLEKGRLLEAAQKHRSEESTLAQIEEEHRDALVRAPAQGVSAGCEKLRQHDAYIGHLRRKRRIQQARVESSKHAEDEIRDALIEKSQAVQQLEAHRDRKLREWGANLRTAEQKRLDEAAATRFSISDPGT
jgi:flagellar export protein FliJ